jgi:hypothetical protein
MSLYTPPDIAGGLKDFWIYIRQEKPHKWASLGLALTIVGVIFYFIVKALEPKPEPPSIIFVESWPIDRSDFDVRRDWLKRGIEENEQNRRRRHAYGELGNAIGQSTYDKAAADAEFDRARALMEQALADLDAAEAAGQPLPPLPKRAMPQTASPASPAPAAK